MIQNKQKRSNNKQSKWLGITAFRVSFLFVKNMVN